MQNNPDEPKVIAEGDISTEEYIDNSSDEETEEEKAEVEYSNLNESRMHEKKKRDGGNE
jgi:hypothetical protein